MNSELLGQTWDSLAGKQEELIRTFYQRLFEKYPEYNHLFSESFERQMGKMIETMALLARISHETEVTHPKMVKLGERHTQFKLEPEDLQRFKTLFVEVLSEYCAESWTTDCQQAWQEVFDKRVIPYMTEGFKTSETPSQIDMKPISNRTSIRNQLIGTVKSINRRIYHGDVVLELKGGETVSATLTLHSINKMQLTEGNQAHILIRAPHLILARADSGLKFSAGNRLCGQVIHIEQARLSAEITLQLKGEQRLKAIVSQEAISDLGIKEGESICAIFKGSNVVLAVEEK